MYARVWFARLLLGGVYRVDISDKGHKWAISVLFPRRPTQDEPRVIAPGTRMALYWSNGDYYYRELEHIYPLWDGKRTFVSSANIPLVLDFVHNGFETHIEQDLTLLMAGKPTRFSITGSDMTLYVAGVEEIRILR